MPMMRPFPQVHTGLVPFSITYSYSQDFVTPSGCNNVKLVGHGSNGTQEIWSTFSLACIRVFTNNQGFPYPGWGTADYDGVSWDELNAWIQGYFASYGSGNRRTIAAYSPAAHNGPEVGGQQLGIHVSLIFASANPADSDVPVKYGISSPRPMLPPNPTNYPSWGWFPGIVIGDFTGPLIAAPHPPVQNQGTSLRTTNTPPSGIGPITWGSLINWRSQLGAAWQAELTYEIAQPGFIFQPGMPYSMPINALKIGADAQAGEDATGFGRTFPGGVLIPGNGIAGDPNCYGRSLAPVTQTFPTNATSPGAVNPLVVPNGAQITVSGLRFP
jgi:hypothetical protein